ncbi:energy transducer TonB [Formosa sp. PL04]
MFKNEAIRVLSLLPKMQPGTQKGKAVTVPYYLPIVFKIQE